VAYVCASSLAAIARRNDHVWPPLLSRLAQRCRIQQRHELNESFASDALALERFALVEQVGVKAQSVAAARCAVRAIDQPEEGSLTNIAEGAGNTGNCGIDMIEMSQRDLVDAQQLIEPFR